MSSPAVDTKDVRTVIEKHPWVKPLLSILIIWLLIKDPIFFCGRFCVFSCFCFHSSLFTGAPVLVMMFGMLSLSSSMIRKAKVTEATIMVKASQVTENGPLMQSTEYMLWRVLFVGLAMACL